MSTSAVTTLHATAAAAQGACAGAASLSGLALGSRSGDVSTSVAEEAGTLFFSQHVLAQVPGGMGRTGEGIPAAAGNTQSVQTEVGRTEHSSKCMHRLHKQA